MEREESKERRWKRIRIVKKLLKLVPRRDNIHRYPILKYFANAARQRTYLWSFRVTEAVPALYAGWILTLMPVMSVQVIIACVLAFLFRANIMILVALQFISTPFTVPFLWYIAYRVGAFFVTTFGTDRLQTLRQSYDLEWFKQMLDMLLHGQEGMKAFWSVYGQQFIRVFFTTTLGGIILGIILGHLSAALYKYLARYYSQPPVPKI
ncbi:MAG: DUF2062 domain-containing protein [Verrucomicrobiota bacterium]|nr:MAG: DUF2062 domain-containing protein [Verrucomicrobiota bacterium]